MPVPRLRERRRPLRPGCLRRKRVIAENHRLRKPARPRADRWAVTGELAFVKRGAIYAIDAQGRDLRRITTGQPKDSSPDWSPDRQRIVLGRGADISPSRPPAGQLTG